MVKRRYDVELPLNVPGMLVGTYISQLQGMGIWNNLPGSLRRKAETAQASWNSLSLTQEDLDSIPEHLWKEIAAKIGVGWSD